MPNAGFAAASGLALITFAVHSFVGGIYVVRPLLAVQGLSRASRWLNYYCWHMTTLTLLVMAAMFAYSAVEPTARGSACFLLRWRWPFRCSASRWPSRAACSPGVFRPPACSQPSALPACADCQADVPVHNRPDRVAIRARTHSPCVFP